MEDKIEVNEYVRTKNGVIDKVDALYGMIENTVHLENQKWFDIKNIVNHSKQPIDLIEVGDYVNGIRILDITGDYVLTAEYNCCKQRLNNKIKTILTKEQMEANQYVVK